MSDHPNDHTFVPVRRLTGCARCGYAKGQHPTAAHLRLDGLRLALVDVGERLVELGATAGPIDVAAVGDEMARLAKVYGRLAEGR